MKKKILLLMGIFSVGIVLHAQVGINTNNPLGLLHIDAKGNTTGTVLAAVNDADDVAVSTKGYLGIGTVNPQNKVDIRSTTIGALKVVDGNQALGKGFVSDADGFAEYMSVAGSWYGALWNAWSPQTTTSGGDRTIKGYGVGLVANPLFGAVDAVNGTITVPYAGRYRISISGTWLCTVSNGAFAVEVGYTQNGVTKWIGITSGGHSLSTNYPLGATFIIIAPFAAGDKIALFNRENSIYKANSILECYFIVEYIQ